jgi:hypothetical protein
MSTVKSKKIQLGVSDTSTDNFTIYQPSTPDGTLRIGQGNADSPTEVAKITSDGVLPKAPLMYAYSNSSQSISVSTWTKVQLPHTMYDTNSWWDTTNHRFKPQIAGYYQVSGYIRYGGTSQTQQNMHFYFNGSEHSQVGLTRDSVVSETFGQTIIKFNGSTDYVEMYGYIGNGTSTIFDSAGIANVEGTRGSSGARFQAVLIHAT